MHMPVKLVRWLFKWLIRLSVIVVAVVVTIYVVRAFDSRRLPDLKPWHTVVLENEFRADEVPADFDFADYLELEDRLFREVDERIVDVLAESDRWKFSRYSRGGPSYPGSMDVNWNTSQEIVPDNLTGGILLMHGLTDAPYSARSIGELLAGQGLYVVIMRYPGHGTIPGELRHTRWEDWFAVARIAMQHLRGKIGNELPIYIGGYSTGGALALKYTLAALDDPELESVERVFMFSPAVGITSFAVFSNWHRLLSDIPYFAKFEWTGIQPEYDPFKYNSFPKMGGHEVFELAGETLGSLITLYASGRIAELPPMIAFHSLVDSTVLTPPLIDLVFNKFEDGDSRLVLFDVNRWGPLDDFIRNTHDPILERIFSQEKLGYAFTLVTNKAEDSLEVVARTQLAFEADETVEELGLAWGPGLFSLSHVAIPFPPEDPIYGIEPNEQFVQLGVMAPRGERRVLAVSLDQLMRLRYNPFHSYMSEQIVGFCPACADYPEQDSSTSP